MSPAIKLSMKLPGLFKSQKFAYFIDDKMKLKSKEPSQTGFPSAGQTFKDFISGDSNVLANCYRARVNLADACYLASAGLKIGRQWDQAGWHTLNKTMR